MQLRHLKSVLSPIDGLQKVTALAWAPNNQKLAAVTTDKVVYLFDENGDKKDKFKTKPADPNSPKGYIIRGMAFSPDSTKLAIAQSDAILFIYRLGSEWGEKKSICNKFQQTAPVTALVWPAERHNEVVFGGADGKVKVGLLKTNKPFTLYEHPEGSFVSCLASSRDGSAVLSGHADGSIYVFRFDSGGAGGGGKLAQHSCMPSALAWGTAGIAAVGADSKVAFYDTTSGALMQQMDYSTEEAANEFSIAAFNPSGDSMVAGREDALHAFHFNAKQGAWEEAGGKQVEHLYTVTALDWKPDGSRLTLGNLCGSVDLLDACLRRHRYKGSFEFTYVSSSQVIVKRLSSGMRIVLKSAFGLEVEKINIYQDRFLVAHTTESLLLGDLETCKLSEIPWMGSGQEKFHFDNPQVCMVYSSGELTLVQYGQNEVLGVCRTEHMSSYLISVRINAARGIVQPNKMISYLVDLQTIRVLDLLSGATAASISHDARVDWLELNARATHLLFRDKRRHLHLYSIARQERVTLLTYCSYVQWVPGSDVVVAQNRGSLCVWYNINSPDKQTVVPIKGDVEDIQRSPGKTEVLVEEGMASVSYLLDESLMDFGTALDEHDFDRAAEALAPLELTAETEAQWQQLAKAALAEGQLGTAERCYAALGDVAKARYLQQISLQAGPSHDPNSFVVRAGLARLQKQWGVAEALLLAQGKVEEAIRMYIEAHKWQEAIKVAERSKWPETASLKREYAAWLLSSGQEETAGAMKEQEGDYLGAIALYLKGGLPVRAAKVVLSKRATYDVSLLDSICVALSQAGLYEKAGELYEQQRRFTEAQMAYRRGHCYRKALDLARRESPGDVVLLEEQWGDWLMSQHQVDAAINHFIEAGQTIKAIDAAMAARQWQKAAGILDSQDPTTSKPYYKRIAEHFEQAGNLEEAERHFIKAGMAHQAFEMYAQQGKWEAAHKVAAGYLSEQEVSELYTRRAGELAAHGQWKAAEKMYCSIRDYDAAINMYKQQQMYDHMLRLVAVHRRDLLVETHAHLARKQAQEGNFREAEKHFVEARDWQGALQMYQGAELWDAALRIAKQYGGAQAVAQVAYMWAVSLGGDEGSQMLARAGLLDQAIDYAAESGAFAHAFEMCKGPNAQHKLLDVHLKYAMWFEDEGRFQEAEDEFVKAGKPREAIDMWCHQQDWAAALSVAERCDPQSVPDILAAQGNLAATQQDWATAEALFVRAKQPEAALAMYRAARRWEDALRVAEAHLPAKVAEVHEEIQASIGAGSKGPEAALSRAKAFERAREWNRAIDAYLSVTAEDSSNVDFLEQVWESAVSLAMTNQRNRIAEVVDAVAQRLVLIGRHEAAAELLQGIDDVPAAVRAYVQGGLFDKARAAAEGDPALQQYVQQHHAQHLVAARDAEGLASAGNAAQAVELFAQRGDWERVHELAAQAGPDAQARYAVRHAKQKAQQGDFAAAALALAQHGASPDVGNLELYAHVAREVLGVPADAADPQAEEACSTFLRAVLVQLEAGPDAMAQHTQVVRRLWEACHYTVMRRRCQAAGLQQMAAKQATSLLRYIGEIPADKAFYEAGAANRDAGRLNMAFVFLNRYLDLTEAMEDADGSAIENADFVQTDIPFDFHLPEKHYLSEARREEARDWVLAISMDQSVAQELSQRSCTQCGVDTYEGAVICHACRKPAETCAITGYPILPAERVLTKSGIVARRSDWNDYLQHFNGLCPVTGTPQKPII